MSLALATNLVDELRGARADPQRLHATLAASTQRLGNDPAYRQQVLTELRAVLERTHTTHTLTELGLLSDETLVEGVVGRLGEWLAPALEREDSLDAVLHSLFSNADQAWLRRLDVHATRAWMEALVRNDDYSAEHEELASAMVILATRVAGAGMDWRLSERMPSLEAWTSPFLELSRDIDRFAESFVRGEVDGALHDRAQNTIARCLAQLSAFREQKKELGTTLRLSSASLRMLQQLERLSLLLACTQAERRAEGLARLIIELAKAATQSRPILRFAQQKLELVAYLVVGHAVQKGSKYAVHTRSEYRAFWLKSIFGGLIVAIFASFKLHLSHEGLAPVPQALIYGANYALCFALIFLFGATLATKQPALTASRLAESLREGGDGESSFPTLVRAIWRSQFVSFLGNIAGAAGFALLFAYGFRRLVGHDLINESEALMLAAKLHPYESGTAFYAAIAGVMLSTAGMLAGFIDNAVVFHRVADRVRAGRGIFRLVPTKWLKGWLAGRVESSSGALYGNIVLGFMLGSAGAFGKIMGIPFDIRHIAFGSSHAALALWHSSALVTWQSAFMLMVAVSIIGLVNFLVSFSITLAVAINARRLEGVNWHHQLRSLWQLAKAQPISFFLPRETSQRRHRSA